MSYDILFVPRRPGQPWDEALDEAEGRDVLGEALRPDRLAQWDRILRALRSRVGDVAVTVEDDTCEATHPSGLQVSLYPDEASVSFPYRVRPDRDAFHDVVVDVVGILEGETGLHAWDAQTAEPFDGRVHDETGLAAARRIEQEAGDVSATDAMAARADAGHIGPDTGPFAVLPGPDADVAAARDRRRALLYVATGVVIVVVALLLGGDEPSTLTGLAIAIGVFDVVIGGLMYLAWSRRAAGGR